MSDDRAAARFAERLRDAEDRLAPAPLATTAIAHLDWATARAVARARDQLRLDAGDTPIGYKLGWTSAAMRTALGIDRPNWGTLWASQRVDGHLDASRVPVAKIEPEIVFVAQRALEGDDVDAAEVTAAAAGWALGLEVVQPRYLSFEFTWLDNTADNSSAHAVAVGAVSPLEISPAEVELVFGDGAEERAGAGVSAMDSPAEAVAWLVRSLAEEGLSLAAGDIVFTGGLTAPFDVVPGAHYAASSALLPRVSLRIT